jgi:hypothetical protein
MLAGSTCHITFGSRPEAGAQLIALVLLLLAGEAPEGRAKFTKSLPAHARESRLKPVRGVT